MEKIVNATFPIQVASRMSGLSMHVIRIWEQRYGAVAPARTATNRRLYSGEHIERLILLRDATQAGYKIGEVASWSSARLRQAVAAAPVVVPSPAPGLSWLEECREAIRCFDAAGLEAILRRVETEIGALALLQKLLAPLAHELGEWWRGGEITSAQEHFATMEIRRYLSQAAQPFGDLAHAPVLMVTTPAGQIHELGALLVAAVAANLGWRVIYLGASLPAAEIAGAVRTSGAHALALSVVYPADDPALPGELWRLRQLLPSTLPILVGGRASEAYRPALKKIKAMEVNSLLQLGKALDRLRTGRK
mgnify:CR=1 FL=1